LEVAKYRGETRVVRVQVWLRTLWYYGSIATKGRDQEASLLRANENQRQNLLFCKPDEKKTTVQTASPKPLREFKERQAGDTNSIVTQELVGEVQLK